jgi:Undecaprenyl-phosphate glucose phosphotransferase
VQETRLLKKQHQFFVSLLCLADAAVITAACMIAWCVRRTLVEQHFPQQWESWVKGPLFLFIVPIVLYSMWFFGLYRPRRDRSLWREQLDVLKMSVVAVAAVVVALWAVGNNAVTSDGGRNGPAGPAVQIGAQLVDGGRVQLGMLALVLPLLVGGHRTIWRLVLREIRRRGRNLRHVAVVGVGRLGQIACRTISRNSWTGLNVSYFVSHHPRTRRTACLDKPVMGGLEDLERILEEHPVDAVYLAVPNAQAAAVPSILLALEKFALDVRIVPDVHPRFVTQSMALSELDGMPILSYRECPSAGLGGLTKRALDIAGALVALALFAPLLGLIALAVRLSGPGPVIFRQKRVSIGGRIFEIYKFRTMVHVEDEDSAPASWQELRDQWTTRDDPRITRIGAWLRRTSLDELPQLINVLKGHMSLVGPRPERPELIQRFREDWRGYMLRQHVKAGMTGWAQVNGLRGDTSLRKRLQYDLFYVKHWSLWFDMRILWLTVFRGFVHRNAH